MITLTAEQARRIAVRAQLLDAPRPDSLAEVAHISEDTLYYARLRVMEAEGELLHMQLEKKPFKDIHDQLATLADARRRLDERVAEKIEEA